MIAKPRFNPELNWGHLLSAGSFAILALVAFFALQRDLTELRVETRIRLGAVERTMAIMAENIVKIGEQILTDIKQTERLDGHDKIMEIQSRRIDRLEGTVFRLETLPKK